DAQCNLTISCLTSGRFEHLAYHPTEPISTLKDLFVTYLTTDTPTINLESFILKNSVQSKSGIFSDRIDLIAAHPDLIYTDMNIAVYSRPNFRDNLTSSEIYKFQILSRILEHVKYNYDFIFIDCPPNLNYITQNALYASDYYLIPTIPDTLSTYGILSIVNKVEDLNKTFRLSNEEFRPTACLGIILNQIIEYRGKPKDSQSNILSSLRTTFPKKVFHHYLTNGDGITKASSLGYPVYALETSNQNAQRQAQMLREILRELLQRMEGVKQR
ncbi:MAG: ParA family protein, partial [Tuberibacillus sp.]